MPISLVDNSNGIIMPFICYLSKQLTESSFSEHHVESDPKLQKPQSASKVTTHHIGGSKGLYTQSSGAQTPLHAPAPGRQSFAGFF